MSEKFDIEKLREAVEKSLTLTESKKVKIHQGSHSAKTGGAILENKSGQTKQNLFQLAVYSSKLHDMINENQDLDVDLRERITEAINKISFVYHKLEYKNYKEAE